MSNQGVLAIDVGSSRVKLGWFPPTGDCTSDKSAASLPIAAPPLPQPEETLAVSHQEPVELWTSVGAWLQAHCPSSPPAFVASVHPPTLAVLQEMFANRLQTIDVEKIPLEIGVEQPDRVGIDRLLNGLAANRLRAQDSPAIVIDSGTACTVDLISADGVFQGGAILPGMSLSTSALHTGTASLPQLPVEELGGPPNPVGRSTHQAMRSGIYWGMVGAVRELVNRISQECEQAPQLFITGGGASQLAEQVSTDDHRIRHVPSLVLSGIALVSEEWS